MARLVPRRLRWWTVASVLIVALGVSCVVGSWSRLSATFDEP